MMRLHARARYFPARIPGFGALSTSGTKFQPMIHKDNSMKRFRLFMAMAGLAIALSACKQQSDPDSADAGATPSTAEASAPAPKPDALKQEQVHCVVELQSPVRDEADGTSITRPVKITPKGTAVLSRAWRPPV